jgi:hypothetical protein
MRRLRRAHGARGSSAGQAATRPRGWTLWAVGAALIVVLLLSAVTPPRANAGIPNPLSLIPNPLGSLAGEIGELAVGAFDAVIKHLFAPVAKFITVELIGWLAAIPDFTQGNMAELQTTVSAMGGGLLGAVATIAVARYWVAGFAGGGDSGFSALEGLIRAVGAALLLATWPWLFSSAVNLANLASSSLLGSGSVTDDAARLLATGLGVAGALNLTGIGMFLNIAIAVIASLLLLGLLLMKIVLSISTVLVFVGMPMAIVLWPLVPWVLQVALRAFLVCLIVPFTWALCFAASAAMSVNVLSFKGGEGFMDKLLQPLVAIVLLWVMLKLPVTLARVAMLGGQALSGGFVSRAASYAAGRTATDALSQHLPGWAGGPKTRGHTDSERSHSDRTGARLRNAARLAGAAATAGGTGLAATGAAAGGGAAGAVGAGSGGAAAAGKGRGYTPPPSAQAHAGTSANGLQTPSFAGREQDFANEKFEAQWRERTNPVSPEQARHALHDLPEATRRGVGQLVAEHGPGAREHLAYQAMGEWSPQEREALRTLAGASADVRAQAVDDVLGGGPVETGDRSETATPAAAYQAPNETSAPSPGTAPAPIGGTGGGGNGGARNVPAAPPAPAQQPGGPPPTHRAPEPRAPRGPDPDARND